MWIPAHRGIKGNEKVDSLAKQILKNEEVMNISLSKYKAKAVITFTHLSKTTYNCIQVIHFHVFPGNRTHNLLRC